MKREATNNSKTGREPATRNSQQTSNAEQLGGTSLPSSPGQPSAGFETNSNAFNEYSRWISSSSRVGPQPITMASTQALPPAQVGAPQPPPTQAQVIQLSNLNSLLEQLLQQRQEQLRYQQQQHQQQNLYRMLGLHGNAPINNTVIANFNPQAVSSQTGSLQQNAIYPQMPENTINDLQRLIPALEQLLQTFPPSSTNISSQQPPAPVGPQIADSTAGQELQRLLPALQRLVNAITPPSQSINLHPTLGAPRAPEIFANYEIQRVVPPIQQPLQRELVLPGQGDLAQLLLNALGSGPAQPSINAVPAPVLQSTNPPNAPTPVRATSNKPTAQLPAGSPSSHHVARSSGAVAAAAAAAAAALSTSLEIYPAPQSGSQGNRPHTYTYPSVPKPLRRLVPIAMSTDQNSTLSEYQCLVREQIVLFEADEEDLVCSRGRTKPVVVGQVGILCKHCALLPPWIRRRGSCYFPATRIAVYGAAQHMAIKHLLDTCYQIPETIKSRLDSLKGMKAQSARAGRQRWAEDLRELGIAETAQGLNFGPEVEQRSRHYAL